MRQDIEAVAFDLDGTLYPNYRFNVKIIPFALKEWRFLKAFGKARKIIRKEQENTGIFPIQDFYGHQAAITGKILGISPEKAKEKIDSLLYRGWEPLFKEVRIFSNVPETLKALKEKGYKLGLLSDFPPETKLKNMGLCGIWDAVLGSETTGAIKPHKQPFLELAAKLGLPCEKILYVGNSLCYDVAGASRVGMKTAWIKSPFAISGKISQPPDFTFSDYRKLHDYMLN